MRLAIVKVLALVITLSGLSFPAMAQEEGVTHCQFARELCIRLGISIPTTPSPHDIFARLEKDGFYPKEGWECDKALTAGDFARVITQVLENQQKTTLVENRDDDNAFMEYLKGEGFSLDSVKDTMSNIGTLADPSNHGIDAEANTTDPSDSRHFFGEPSEKSSGTPANLEISVNSDGPIPRAPVAPPAPVFQPAAPTTTSSAPSAPVSATTVSSAMKKMPAPRPVTTPNVPG